MIRSKQKFVDLFFFIFLLCILSFLGKWYKAGLILIATSAIFALLRFEKWIEQENKEPTWNDFVEVKVKKKSLLRYFLPNRFVNFIITITGLFEDQVILGEETTLREKRKKREWAPVIIWIIGGSIALYFFIIGR